MLSFRSILLAAAAFATVASAIPTPETTTGGSKVTPGGVGGLPAGLPGSVLPANLGAGLRRETETSTQAGDSNGTPGAGGILPGGILPKLPAGLPRRTGDNAAVAGLPGVLPKLPAGLPRDDVQVKRGYKSCRDIVKKCHEDIAIVVVKIHAAVKCEGGAKNVKHDLVIGLLWEIVEILKLVLHDLKLIVKAEFLLECTIKELAAVVAELLIIVIELVWLVLAIVGFLDISLCSTIAMIGGLLCEILKVLFYLVEGLLVEVVVLIEPYGSHCKYIKYFELLAILKIKA